MFGYTEDEIIGRSAAVFFTPEDRESRQPEKEVETAIAEGRAEDDRWHVRRDGSRFRASGVLTAMRDGAGAVLGFATVMRDVTEREETREKLEASLREKTALLSEVHHRVKNNLQVIVSLISLQASHICDPVVVGMLEETQNRVRAIATIHERLYSTEDLSTIHFGPHLEELARHLAAFYGMSDVVEIESSVADMAVDIDRAVPLALVSNELLCNVFRHAFSDGRKGRLCVALRYVSADPGLQAELEIADDGTGVPEHVQIATAESMGFQLVNILARQLRGSVEISCEHGTRVRLRFPIDDE